MEALVSKGEKEMDKEELSSMMLEILKEQMSIILNAEKCSDDIRVKVELRFAGELVDFDIDYII